MIGRTQRVGLVCAIAAFTIDQATKAIALGFADRLMEGIEVLPIFNLVLTHNRGASLGLFSGLPWWALVVAGLAVVAFLSVWLWRTQVKLIGVALGLVIGGVLGNVLDRARHGAVPDFLDFHIGAYHWPTFNLADVAIVCGFGLLFVREAEWRAA